MNKTKLIRNQSGDTESAAIAFSNFFADVVAQAQGVANRERQTQVIYIFEGLEFSSFERYHQLKPKPFSIASIFPE